MNGKPFIRVYFKAQGQEITTELAYDDLNLIAEIGGYVCLFWGTRAEALDPV